jgi:hypothetical protein
MSFSVRGVARKYAGITSGFSVIHQIFNVPRITGTASLRTRLRTMSRQEHSFAMSECVFGWTSAFEQTWSHIIIRIRLAPDSGISSATVNNLMTTWRNGIVNTWSNRWGCSKPGECPCPFTFEVQWVTTNQHHSVRIQTGPARSNMGVWDTLDTGNVAAHEFGHMLGLVDEYAETSVCPNRNPVNTGTVMDNNSANVPARMMTRFANNIGSSVVGI